MRKLQLPHDGLTAREIADAEKVPFTIASALFTRALLVLCAGMLQYV